MSKGKEEPKKGSRSGPEEKRMQGHWLLAAMGKRVLRPGGMEMTVFLIDEAKPTDEDRIVEFGPGVGKTAELLLRRIPRSYTGVDPNPEGSKALKKVLAGRKNAGTVKANAKETGLEDGCADLVIGEAMLTMHSDEDKAAIIKEAARLLSPGGRYAIHELGLHPEDLDDETKNTIRKDLSRIIKVGARPLTTREWTKLLENAGLEVKSSWENPMALLEPKRMIDDEGIFGALRFAKNMITNKAGRERVLGMRGVFRKHAEHINAVGIVAVKPAG